MEEATDVAARLGDTVAELAGSRLAACIWRGGTLQKTRGGGLRSLTLPRYLEGLYPYLVHPHYQPIFHRGRAEAQKGRGYGHPAQDRLPGGNLAETPEPDRGCCELLN